MTCTGTTSLLEYCTIGNSRKPRVTVRKVELWDQDTTVYVYVWLRVVWRYNCTLVVNYPGFKAICQKSISAIWSGSVVCISVSRSTFYLKMKIKKRKGTLLLYVTNLTLEKFTV